MLNNITIIGEILDISIRSINENFVILKVAIPTRTGEERCTTSLPIVLSENVISIIERKLNKGDMIGVKGYLTCDCRRIKIIGQRVELFS